MHQNQQAPRGSFSFGSGWSKRRMAVVEGVRVMSRSASLGEYGAADTLGDQAVLEGGRRRRWTGFLFTEPRGTVSSPA